MRNGPQRLGPVLAAAAVAALMLACQAGGAASRPAEPARPVPTSTTANATGPVPTTTLAPKPAAGAGSPPAVTGSAAATGAAPAAGASVGSPNAASSATPPAAPQRAAPAASPAARAPAAEPPRFGLEPLAVTFQQPVFLTHAGDGSGRLFVVEKAGRIRIVKDGAVLPTPFLDIADRVGSSGNEQGLLGLAFHPRYAENGRFFVNYTNRQGDTIVERYAVSGDPERAEPTSTARLLEIDQPAQNHNGGMLAFGPDGYLWIGMGDGGASGDRFGNGQNRQTLLAKMLRLDVDAGEPYAIPPDNPYIGRADARPEIWAIGLRNPWRYSFDRATGDLWIGDVGQNAYEEIDVVPATAPDLNYGWPVTEGRHCYPEGARCDPSPYVQPVAEYGRDGGCSVTGGYVYRGRAFPSLQGVYVYADFCTGRVWSLDRAPSGAWRTTQQVQQPLQISSFGEDEAGELYATTFTGDSGAHRVYRVVAR